MRTEAAWARVEEMSETKRENRAVFRRDRDSVLRDVTFIINANFLLRLATSPPSQPSPVKGEGVSGVDEERVGPVVGAEVRKLDID